MPDKNHNNPVGWRGRLEAHDQVPGLKPFNKSEAWDKLSDKLEVPEKKNKKAFFWLVAAAIMTGVLLSIALFLQDKTGKELPVVFQQPAPPPLMMQEQPPSGEIQTAIDRHSINQLHQKVKVNPENHQPLKSRPVVSAFEEKEISPALHSVRLQQEPDGVILNTIDSPALTLSPLPNTKKKLAVVYLNEIESGNTGSLTNQPVPKKHKPLYPKFRQPGGDDVYIASKPERFTISISSAN